MTVTHNAMTGAIRALSMDAVQKANSGHPGMPMGMADVATILFSKFLKFDPARPDWPDRDRFVLSAGHGSMLLYSLLYLTGYARPTIDDIKAFRQLGSPCAGHPEVGELPGIECTTGPLGQGLGMAVGMALAERMQAARYGDDIVDHHTYVIAGDGCLMEGISHEAMSMAGHLKLGKLILLWDDNSISIDGATDLTVSDDQGARFQAHGWHTLQVDGHDPAAIETAIEAAHGDARPTLIACKTIIGYGAPNKQGTAATHGAPLGDDEIAATREALDWPHAPFDIPADILEGWRQIGRRSQDDVAAWQARLEAMEAETRTAFEAGLTGIAPDATFAALDQLKRSLATNFENGPQKVATRKASQMALEVINGACQITIGGSADLTGSNNTNTSQTLPISADDFSGRYIYYGVREFAMGTVMNGMALHGGFIPYGGTFMVFTDYARPAIRLSALMGQGVIYVMTHDSIGLGEDGPTHQPVEHLASLRAMPGLNVLRPADVVETAEAWEVAIKDRTRPTIIALSRQGLAQVRGEYIAENKVACGGYVLKEASGVAQVTLIATGSEVGVALDAQTTLEADGIATRVVSMPSTGHFDAQEPAYRDEVLGTDTLKVSIEAGATFGWHKYVGADGITIGIDSFGGSAPAPDLYEHFGITAARVVSKVTKRIK